MAEFGPLTNAFISINAVDLSDHNRTVSLQLDAEAPDDTVMGDTARSEAGGGLFVHGGSAEFNQDYASGSVDATLSAAVGTKVTVTIRPDTAAVSTTNPQYSGPMLIRRYQPLGQNVGDQAVATVEFGGGLLSRTTS